MSARLYKIGPCTGHIDIRKANGEYRVRDLVTVSSGDDYRVIMTLYAGTDRQREFRRTLSFSDTVWHYDCEFPGEGYDGNNLFELPAEPSKNAPSMLGNLREFAECELALAWSPQHCLFDLTLYEVEITVSVVATGYSLSPILEV